MSHFPSKVKRPRVFHVIGGPQPRKPTKMRVSGTCKFGRCTQDRGHKGRHTF